MYLSTTKGTQVKPLVVKTKRHTIPLKRWKTKTETIHKRKAFNLPKNAPLLTKQRPSTDRDFKKKRKTRNLEKSGYLYTYDLFTLLVSKKLTTLQSKYSSGKTNFKFLRGKIF